MSNASGPGRPAASEGTEASSFDTRKHTPVQRLQHFLHGNPAAVPMIVVVVSVVVFAATIGPKFYSAFTLTLILQQVAITGIVSAGQTLIILTAGIDLSVGSIMVLSSVVMGQFAMHYGVPGFVAVIAGLAAGGLCGLINGLLVSLVKLPPFIVTLGTWSIFGAITFIYSGNETVRSQDIDQTAPILHFFGNSFRIGHAVFTYGVILMVALSALLWFALNKTAWGRHVYAVGDDKNAAMLAGIRTGRVLVSVYVVTGLICGLAGWALIGRIGSVSPQAGQLENINAITAVVIGGTSLFGGRGSILGTLFGALIVGVFSLGLRLLGTDPQWTQLTVGALIIIAVATDQWIRKVSA
ncbi:ABC transporter permease [Salinisphaera hydrothermalis]|uniref:Sugar ABC transporter transmembrane protein n=1 Tax=Salinisphaera hydrothermalis (strain C41B8) TaxID=1304275 RepID=A0A084IMN6_SALHC|nr:ABC transporter permease [Salinisphaera hydrothermalis]KEZ77970.1 sugar ABC transporter transmembrane protein [Salinisphaera hydrothermalis C41B8]